MPDLTPPQPTPPLPKDTAIGQAAKSGRWWTQCTRPSGCDFYSSCLLTKEAALEVARIHSATHDRFQTVAKAASPACEDISHAGRRRPRVADPFTRDPK